LTIDADSAAPPDLGSRALTDPEILARNRTRVRRSFWRKLRRVAGQIPFAEDAVAMYYCALDSATPLQVRATVYAALAYFILPTDLVPDFIAGLGFGDDATVIAAAVSLVARHISPAHRRRAREALLVDSNPPASAPNGPRGAGT
jgi:uncharacterized membrane protein YkvA (DUF1232 family)